MIIIQYEKPVYIFNWCQLTLFFLCESANVYMLKVETVRKLYFKQ